MSPNGVIFVSKVLPETIKACWSHPMVNRLSAGQNVKVEHRTEDWECMSWKETSQHRSSVDLSLPASMAQNATSASPLNHQTSAK